MNLWEALYMQAFRQHGILIAEQQVGDSNPLYELINTTKSFRITYCQYHVAKHTMHIHSRALFVT